MIRIDAKIVGTEALVRLDTLPKRFQQILRGKLENFLRGPARDQMFEGLPGRYLDPKYVDVEVEIQGNILIGSIVGEDKPGEYGIVPKTAAFLAFRAKSGDWVVTKRVLHHPYLKSGPVIERYFRDHKPWLLGEIEDLIFEAVYNAR